MKMGELIKTIKKEVRLFNWKVGIQKGIKPPHTIKEGVVRFYKKEYNLNTLVETGTYEGEMVEAFKKEFEEIFSIELNPSLVEEARKRFFFFDNVTIIEGDSSKELPKILKQLTQPCLFWLDAHYSGGKTSRGKKETPILEELKLITKHSSENIILIDDADNFGKGDYPSIQELREIIEYDFIMIIENNIIQIFPKEYEM